VVRKQVVFTVTEADAAANGKTPQETAAEFCRVLRTALFNEMLNNPRLRF
jgi:hypothetical protein